MANVHATLWRLRNARGLLRRFVPARDATEREFRRRGPWVTRFRLDGRDYGGSADLVDDARVDEFLRSFPDCRSVLELGSLEGAHSFALARRVERVVAVDGRAANVDKARFVQSLLGVPNVEFREANLETVDLAELGEFDAVFCVGLLYHLPRPWELLDGLAAVAPRVFLQTHYAESGEVEVDGVPGRRYREFGERDPLSGLSPDSFWMTLPALVERLERNGYAVRILADERHPNGPLVTLAASQ
jgi:SAM-dependent methyltransferase